MSEEEILHILSTRLSINVVTGETYTGGMGVDSGSLYEKCQTIQLLLDGMVISETSL